MAESEDSLEPRVDAEASVDDSESAIYTTAARALIVGLALTGSSLAGDMVDSRAIGLAEPPQSWGGWKERVELIEFSDQVLDDFDVLEHVQSAEMQPFDQRDDGAASKHEQSVTLWREVASEGHPATSIAWLRLLLADRHPIASAAASAALSHWRRSGYVEVPTPLVSARANLRSLSRSSHGDARLIANAALGQGSEETSRYSGDPTSSLEPHGEIADDLSLMVHGTFGWEGLWWDRDGDFHKYVSDQVRPNLYAGDRPFGWSGFYLKRDRERAAERLARWSGGGGLDAIFAHSYGGIVALRSTHYGLKVRDLVLLSTPGELVGANWGNIGRAVSLRIHLDLVLLAARRPWSFEDNVDENFLPYWFVSHSHSHDPLIWEAGNWSKRLGLT
jgi:hypothetical protein